MIALEEGLGLKIEAQPLPDESVLQTKPTKPQMATLQLDSGKKNKLRPGDIVGALTASKQLTGDDLGKIQVYDIWSFVAVKRSAAGLALQMLQDSKIKGKSVRARVL